MTKLSILLFALVFAAALMGAPEAAAPAETDKTD